MIITRKIEVFVCENDKDIRKAHLEKLYANRNIAVKVANLGVSHLFVIDNTMPYLSDEDREKITFLGVKGNKATKQNAPYVAASEAFKGQADMGMVSCVLQNAQKMYQDDRKKGMWNRSLRSYKGNMPIPYKADRFQNLRFAEYVNNEGKKRTGCFFTLMGVPFQMKFGRDRSGNRFIVERVIDGQYKMCTSSIAFQKVHDKKKDKDVTKIFLYLCVDIPKVKVELDPKKILYTRLGVANPIICVCNNLALNKDSLKEKSEVKWFSIGSSEEFLFRRKEIQEARHRYQVNSRYNKGGKGRKRKHISLKRFDEMESNYVKLKLHEYSKSLVTLAIDQKCGEIFLVDQERREKKVKKDDKNGEHTVLRNWSYFNLKNMIVYKAAKYGIKVTDPKKGKDNEEEDIVDENE